MPLSHKSNAYTKLERRRILGGACAICIGVLCLTFFSNWSFSALLREQARASTIALARHSISKDVALRAWVADLGGIYAPVTSGTPPNPWLPLKERDFVLENGVSVTRINPAYATRLVQEKWMDASAGRSRLVSAKPTRPGNHADSWESAALDEMAQQKTHEKAVVEGSRDGPVVRIIEGLRVKQNCLTCHQTQGYEVGDVIGGISVTLPVGGFLRMHDTLISKIAMIHLSFALICVLGVAWFTRGLLLSLRRRDTAENSLTNLAESLELRVEERTRQLHASEAHSLRLLNATTDGIIGMDPEGMITFVNSTAQPILGYNEKELIGLPLHETLHKFTVDGVAHGRSACSLCQARQASDKLRFSMECFTRKDGSQVLISGSIAPVREDGVTMGAILAFHDISDVYKTDVLQRAVFNNASEPIFIWDADRTLRTCNNAAVKYFGAASVEEVLADPYRFMPAEMAEIAVAEAVQAAFDYCDLHKALRTDWVFLHADGSCMPCEGNLIKITSAFGSAYFASFHDMREIRAYESILESERMLLSAIIQAAPSAMLICSAEGKALLCNPSAERLTGLAAGESTLEAWEEPQAYQALCAAAREGRPAATTTLAIKGDGPGGEGRRETLAGISTVLYQGDESLLVWLQDITDLNAARMAAEASTHAKSDFLARMSHEIRTPMNAILGMTYLMMQTEVDSVQHHYLERTQKAARNLLGLINDILDFSKIEAGRMTMESAPFLLSEVLENTADLFSFNAGEKGIELLFYVAPEVPFTLVGDILRFSQVIINLMTNAVKFTSEGAVSLAVNVQEKVGDHVTLEVEVTDTGIGMNEEQMDLLFKPFQQVDTSTTRRFGGTGLGLVICERLVSLMGGRIWASSEPEQGSTFAFTATFGVMSTEGIAQDPALDCLSGKKVLLAMANAEARRMVRMLLADLWMTVAAVPSGADAIKAVQEADAHYDLALIDQHLPDMGGIECSSLITDCSNGALPCALMIPLAKIEEYRSRPDLDVAGFVAKPIGRVPLRNMMVEILHIDAEQVLVRKRSEQALPEDLRNIRGASILLVEDNEINQEVALNLLSGLGMDVTLAHHGQDAVEQCRARSFDLVFMDIQMPVMDGLEATRQIRALPGHEQGFMPIVAMTAHAMSGDREKSLEAGMDDHITKPIDPQMLCATLLRWLRARP